MINTSQLLQAVTHTLPVYLNPDEFTITSYTVNGQNVIVTLTANPGTRGSTGDVTLSYTRVVISQKISSGSILPAPASTITSLYDLLPVINETFGTFLEEHDLPDVVIDGSLLDTAYVEVPLDILPVSTLYTGSTMIKVGLVHELEDTHTNNQVYVVANDIVNSDVSTLIARTDTFTHLQDDTFECMSNVFNVVTLDHHDVYLTKNFLVVNATVEMDYVVDGVVTSLDGTYMLYINDVGDVVQAYDVSVIPTGYNHVLTSRNDDRILLYKVTPTATNFLRMENGGISLTYALDTTWETTHAVVDTSGNIYLARSKHNDGVSDLASVHKFSSDGSVDPSFKLEIRSRTNNNLSYTDGYSIKDMSVTGSYLDVLLDVDDPTTSTGKKPIVNEGIYVPDSPTPPQGTWIPVVRVSNTTGIATNMFNPSLDYVTPEYMYNDSSIIHGTTNYIVSTDRNIYYISYVNHPHTGTLTVYIRVIDQYGRIVYDSTLPVANKYHWRHINDMALVTGGVSISGYGVAIINGHPGTLTSMVTTLDFTNEYHYYYTQATSTYARRLLRV